METGSQAAETEQLARYLTQSSWIRRSDQTVKPDAFVPYPYPDLSVTKHGKLSDAEIWKIGKQVATERRVNLHGRADFGVNSVKSANLVLVDDPVDGNPNHAVVNGWPAEKPAQKAKAQIIAAAAKLVLIP